MRQALADARQKYLKKSCSTETGQTKPFYVLLNQELLSIDYAPPQDMMDILPDLMDLYVHYCINSFIPSIETALDFSLCKLLVAVKTFCTITSLKGSRELTRTKTSTKAKKEQTDKRKGFIIAIYEHGKGIEAGTKFNKACTIIRKQFENSRGSKGPWGTIPMDPKEIPTQSIDTIETMVRRSRYSRPRF